MSEKKTELTTLVVCVKPNHPSGQRNRAGFTFTATPQVISATPEQEQIIREDAFLRIIERGTAFDDAMQAFKKKQSEWSDSSEGSSTGSSEDLKSDAGSNKKEDPTEGKGSDEKTSPDANSDGSDTESNGSQQKDPADLPPADQKPAETAAAGKPIARMNKEELIAALEAKGMKAGTDFSPEANNKDLAALLAS